MSKVCAISYNVWMYKITSYAR